MRFAILAGLVLLLWFSAAAPHAADEPKPLAPAEKYRALVRAHQVAGREYSKANAAAKTDRERQRVADEFAGKVSASSYASRFLALIVEHPKDPVVLDAFLWLLAHLPSGDETDRALKILLRHWIGDERLEAVCKSPFSGSGRAGERLLRAAMGKSPHRAVQGYAHFSLALALRAKAESMAIHAPSNREPYEREAEKLLRRVIEEYADLKHVTTLGQEAQAQLFVMQHLAIGKTPPDIKGEDLDGKKMRLADFRGKVVLLTFWGSWCVPCMSDVPHQRSLAKRFEGKPFAIVGINTDKNRGAARKVCAKEGMAWRSFWDGGDTAGPIANEWNVQEWPTLYLIDGKGVIRYKGDRLRGIGIRDGKDGKPEQFRYLDEAVDALVKEAETKKAK
jgi:thiol-disulfide isomerase/thioredoxin